MVCWPQRFFCLWLFVCVIFFASDGYSSAWLLAPDERLSIQTLRFHSYPHYFNSRGTRARHSPFRKADYQHYVEHGYRSDLTIGMDSSVAIQHQTPTLTTADTSSVSPYSSTGTIAFFARTLLYQTPQLALSWQPLLAFPSVFFSGNQAEILSHRAAVELRGLLGWSGAGTFFSQRDFASIEAAYRHYADGDEGRFSLDASYGVYPANSSLLLLSQFFITLSGRGLSLTPLVPHETTRYDLASLQLSTVFPIAPATSLQLGGFLHITGRDVGAGGGTLIGIWRRF